VIDRNLKLIAQGKQYMENVIQTIKPFEMNQYFKPKESIKSF